MKQATMINDLTTGSVLKKMLAFAAPFMLANALQTVYNMVDMIVIGRFVGTAGLSAVAIGGDISNFFLFLGTGFASAGQVIISQYVGRREHGAINNTIGTMFTFEMITAVVLAIIGFLGIDVFLGWMNTPAEALTQARLYSVICFCGTPFIFGYNTVSAILRGMGDSKRPLLFIAIASVVNLVLDLWFTISLGMGAEGVALATVLGQGVSFIISVIYLYRRKEAFGFDFKAGSFRIDRSKLIPLIKLGLPMALQFAAICISMLFCNSFVNSYGLTASAVTGVGNKLNSIMSIFTMSLGAAATAMIGQSMGAGKTDRTRSVIWYCFGCCLTAVVLVAGTFLLYPREIFSLFNTDEAVLAMAGTYMITAAVTYLSYACMNPFSALINGIGFATLSFVIAILDGVVARIGLSLLFGLAMDMGIFGFWLGNACAGFFTAIPSLIYYITGRWKHRDLIIGK